jgi:hypothetical protein
MLYHWLLLLILFSVCETFYYACVPPQCDFSVLGYLERCGQESESSVFERGGGGGHFWLVSVVGVLHHNRLMLFFFIIDALLTSIHSELCHTHQPKYIYLHKSTRAYSYIHARIRISRGMPRTLRKLWLPSAVTCCALRSMISRLT